mgnify:FL=1
MLDGIIRNSDNSYELLKVIDGKLGAFHVSKDGFSKSDSKYINTVLNKLRFNSNCIYLTDVDGYSIYYDSETGFKHFMKEDKEDFEMFVRANGKDATMYLSSDSKNKKRKPGKKIARAFGISILSITIILGSFDVFHIREMYGVNEDLIVLGIHSVPGLYDLYKTGPMDYMDAIEAINDSEFDAIDKQLLGNEELLKLVFKYYEGTPMKYTANAKFNDIKLKVYNGDEGEREAQNYGYYSILEPNVLNVRKDSRSSTLVHEFIHLLQADGCCYSYLNEAVATLMTKEFYNLDSSSYPDAVDNLKLLISIVGPEPIYKLVFGGDDSDLLKIFRDNLTNDEVISLVDELRSSPSNTKESEQYQYVRESLFKLYKNMYGSDISDNAELALIFLNEDSNDNYSPLYLNVYKILNDGDERSILINDDNGKRILVGLGYLNVMSREYYKKDISYDEYTQLNLVDREEVTFRDSFSKDMINGCILEKEGVSTFYRLDSPVRRDDYLTETGYDKESIKKLPGEKISLVKAFETGDVEATLRKEKSDITDMEGWTYCDTKSSLYVSTNPNVTVLKTGEVLYTAESMKAKFSDQYSRIGERVNDSIKIAVKK